ncbi:MAG: phosphate ABC transporter substrate-binding protein [Leptospiraceae bacterium]|nr:phosphate ABC transporter substrate-binding protein [Leptospiraceae bacterium]
MKCNRFVTLLLVSALALSFAACKEKRKLVIRGSNTMLPILKLVEKTYEEEHPDVDLVVSGPGSEAGLDALEAGEADIATSSREVYPGELDKLKENGPVEVQEVAYDCLLLVVHPDNPIESLRLQETSDIFAGKIKNWKEVGGADLPIKVLVRNEKSGSADYFEEHVLRQLDLGEAAFEKAREREYAEGAEVVESNADMSKIISDSPGAIGFMGMGSAEKVHTALVQTLNYARVPGEQPVAPTIENVYNRTYRLSRPMYLVFRPGKNADADTFAEWMISDEGQRMIKAAGYLRNTMEEIQVIEQKNKSQESEK